MPNNCVMGVLRVSMAVACDEDGVRRAERLQLAVGDIYLVADDRYCKFDGSR